MPFFTTLINFTGASSTYAGVSPYAQETFTNYLPFVYISVGVMVGALLALFVGRLVVSAVNYFVSRLSSGGASDFVHRYKNGTRYAVPRDDFEDMN